MDIDTLLCVVEVLVGLLITAAAAVIQKRAAIRQSLGSMRETTRATHPQWSTILAGVLGANLGYILLVGIFSLVMWLENPTEAGAFLIPATVVVYLMCAVPIYLPVGAVLGLLIYQFAQRRAMGTRAGFITALSASTFLGAILSIPIYLVGLIAAAF